MYRMIYRCALPFMMAMSLSLSAFAQDSSNQRQDDRRQDDQQQRSSTRDRADQENAESSQQNSDGQDGQAQDYRLQPRGWVRVATDYDNNGTYDAVETIYYYDLQQARERSKKRSDGQENNANARGSENDNQQRFARKARVRGEIAKLSTKASSRENVRNVMARVRTENGRTANVCLGPERAVSKLDLKRGDRVFAEGVLTRMKGRPALLAARVEANGETVTHKLTRRKNITRHKGELVNLRTANSRRGDGQYSIARIETDQGTKTVHLGPKEQLAKLELSEGDQISVLTRKGNVSGNSALIALQVTANDETVKVVRQSMRQSRRDRDRDRDRN